MHSFFAEFQSKLSGTFKIYFEAKLAIISEFFCIPEVAPLTHAYDTYPICW